SLIFYGPSGTGKSALAYLISTISCAKFEFINAAICGVSEVKKIIFSARQRKLEEAQRTILFIDEIHRFNKAQQDVLIGDLEQGNIILIGATTHNPYFYLVPALISRTHIFEFKPHSDAELLYILKTALNDSERGMGQGDIVSDEQALLHLCRISDGDARRALNALEIGILTTPADKNGKKYFSLEAAEECVQKKALKYDKNGDAHYDTISAFIKSMRGSDPDAALYWLAKMLCSGEDPRFIVRRIIICAAEDVGNADPHALILSNAALQAVEFVGMPEARIILAQAVIYVSCAPKSNAAYLAIEKAIKDVESEKGAEVPVHLKDASYKSAKKNDSGQGYQYAHNFSNHYVQQQYMGKKCVYYYPTEQGYEKRIKQWLIYLKKT
ncbi:MAG: replication-associated recombination protein A, partial [Candidatus Omnitrophota bacterium]